jgi:hypothetical protein
VPGRPTQAVRHTCSSKLGVQKYFLYALKSIQCVECGITEIYLLLIAENLLKYILLLFFFFGFETYCVQPRNMSCGTTNEEIITNFMTTLSMKMNL